MICDVCGDESDIQIVYADNMLWLECSECGSDYGDSFTTRMNLILAGNSTKPDVNSYQSLKELLTPHD